MAVTQSPEYTYNYALTGNGTQQLNISAYNLDRQRYLGIQVQLYISPLLFLLGTLGNVMSFMVLMRRRMRTIAMYNFLLVLAVADTMVLWFSCLKSWIRGVSGFELLHVSEAACKALTFLFLSSSYLASWLIVLMTTDRFLAIWFPLDMQSKWSTKQARMTACALTILAFAANLHVFWTFGLYSSRGHQVCTFNHDVPFMIYGFDYIKLALYCFIPFFLVLTMNTLIIYRLKRNPLIHRHGGAGALYGPSSFDACMSQPRERISYLLLTVSFTWLFLMLPYSLMRFIATLHNTSLLRILCFMLMYANHSINFFLYCLTGRKFREELKALLGVFQKPRQYLVRRSTMNTESHTNGIQMRPFRHHATFHSGMRETSTGTPPPCRRLVAEVVNG